MERNITLDYFKIFLSILVITTHIASFAQEEVAIALIPNGISRIAIPLFFLISGLYVSNKLTDFGSLVKYLTRLVIIYCVWAIIYLPFYIEQPDVWSFIKLCIIGYYHLWYLVAAIVGIGILFLMTHVSTNNWVLLAVALCLFGIGYCYQLYDISKIVFVRNGIFFGFPFIALGYLMGVYKDRLIVFKYNLLAPILIVCILAMLLESYLAYEHNMHFDFFISTLLLCPVVLLIVLKNSIIKKTSPYIYQLSAAVYLTHIFVIEKIITTDSSLDNVSNLPAIFLVAVLISIPIIYINQRIKIVL